MIDEITFDLTKLLARSMPDIYLRGKEVFPADGLVYFRVAGREYEVHLKVEEIR